MADPVAYVWYNGKRLIPAPLLKFSKNYHRKGSSEIIGADLTVTMTGNLVACKGFDFSSGLDLYSGSGYPDDDTVCCKFDNLLNMQEKIRDHFAVGQDYKEFKVQQVGYTAKTWYARVVSVEFGEGTNRWVETVPYTIVLELQSNDTATIGDVSSWPDDNIIDFNESWSVEFREQDGELYWLSHELTCQAKDYYDGASLTKGWQKAKEWITNRLAGTDYTGSSPAEIKNDIIFTSTGFNLSGYSAYNYEKDQSIDELTGTFTVKERWELAKDPIFRMVDITVAPDDFGEDTVSLRGRFIGLLDTSGSNPNAARDAFDSWIASSGHYTLANTYYNYAVGSGTLGTSPLSSSIRYINEVRGSSTLSTRRTREVAFSYEFSTKNFCNTDAYKESIDVTIQNQADVFAQIYVLGRSQGPLIQDKGTSTAKKYTINIQWQYPKANGCNLSMPSGVDTAVQNVITNVGICPGASGTYVESDTASWLPRTGIYKRSITYVCEAC